MAWFSQSIPVLREWFNIMFTPDWTHIVMHALLYAVLGFGIAYIAGPEKAKLVPVLIAVLVVGASQELLQPLPAGGFPTQAALLDLAVDLAGGLIGFALYVVIARRKAGVE